MWLFRPRPMYGCTLKIIKNINVVLAGARSRSRHSQGSCSQIFDNFLILDFESTCEKNKKIKPQEIIEFPCLKVNSSTFKVDAIFHHYVKPQVNATLTPFCTDLTGILQEMVDDEPSFENVLPLFSDWLLKHKLFEKEDRSIFVTSGDWDLQVMLPDQCLLSNLQVPNTMASWINIKKSYSKATGHFPRGIHDMLARLNLPHSGRLHSGIDDCRNILTILHALAGKGFIFEPTGQLHEPTSVD